MTFFVGSFVSVQPRLYPIVPLILNPCHSHIAIEPLQILVVVSRCNLSLIENSVFFSLVTSVLLFDPFLITLRNWRVLRSLGIVLSSLVMLQTQMHVQRSCYR